MYKTGADDGGKSDEEESCGQKNKGKEEIRRPREMGSLSSGICRKIMVKRKEPWFGMVW